MEVTNYLHPLGAHPPSGPWPQGGLVDPTPWHLGINLGLEVIGRKLVVIDNHHLHREKNRRWMSFRKQKKRYGDHR